jgi:uncharacterized repeat protein (TIGR03833 family)
MRRTLMCKCVLIIRGGDCTVDGKKRADIRPGLRVKIVLKQDQRMGNMTEGIVAEILTNSSFHPHGVKVRLESGAVGRLQVILS